MTIMRDPCRYRCPMCNAIQTQNEDSFCHNCLEWLPDPVIEIRVAGGP